MPIPAIPPTHIGVLLCGMMVMLGPLYTVEDYSVVSHTVNQLGAQNTPGRWFLNLGFLTLGIGVGLDARRLWWTAPFVSVFFIMFAIAVAMMAIFSPRPIDPAQAYSDMGHVLHAVFATAGSLCFCVGAAAYGFYRRTGPAKWLGIGAGVVALLLWFTVFTMPDIQGVLQRLMYTVVFAWLAAYLPHPLGKKA